MCLYRQLGSYPWQPWLQNMHGDGAIMTIESVQLEISDLGQEVNKFELNVLPVIIYIHNTFS